MMMKLITLAGVFNLIFSVFFKCLDKNLSLEAKRNTFAYSLGNNQWLLISVLSFSHTSLYLELLTFKENPKSRFLYIFTNSFCQRLRPRSRMKSIFSIIIDHNLPLFQISVWRDCATNKNTNTNSQTFAFII